MINIIQCPKLHLGNWHPSLSKRGHHSSKVVFQEELDDHDLEILETQIVQNTRQKILPIADVQMNNEEFLARQKHEKETLNRYIEGLKIGILEREHDKGLTDEKKVRLEVADDDEDDDDASSPITDIFTSSSRTGTVTDTSSVSPKITIKSWIKGDLLGSGSFGKVYEAISDEGFFFAVKVVSWLDQGCNAQQIEHEIAFCSQFAHENIIQYYGTDYDERKKKLYIFMELVTQGSLRSLYQKYKLHDAHVSAYTRQILNGLMYLHGRNIVHRDIKCANVLIDSNGSVKLAEFALAKQLVKINKLQSTKRSVYWMAPEVVTSTNKVDSYTTAADIWSLGCTVLEMLTRQIPYPDLEWIYALFKIGRGEPPQIPKDLSIKARDFISQCLRVNPEERPTTVQLLEHPFVK